MILPIIAVCKNKIFQKFHLFQVALLTKINLVINFPQYLWEMIMITRTFNASCGLRPLLVSLLFCLIYFESYSSELIVRPPDGKVGKDQVLIFLPGARVPAENYQDLLGRIQNEVHRPLWTITLKFLGDVPQPVGLKTRVKRVIKNLNKSLKSKILQEDIWLSGHSLGGINARRIASEYGGLILLSSYFDRLGDRNKTDFPKFEQPVLLLSGELDGLTRPAYLARDAKFDTTNSSIENWNKSVILLPEVNHSLFAYDDYLLSGDLPTTLEPSVGRELIAEAAGLFMTIHSNQTEASLKANSMESLYEFKKKSNELLRSYEIAYSKDSTLCGDAQELIIKEDLGQSTKLKINSETEKGIHKFALAKPIIEVNSEKEPVITTVKFVDHYRNIIDLGNISLAPKASFCKMKSSESLVNSSLDGEIQKRTSCSKIQRRLMLETLYLLTDKQYQRYLDSGKILDIVKEKKNATGIGWLSSGSDLIDEEDGDYFVRTRSLYTNLDAPEPFSGMTYCKLVTPARLLDWYLIDALIPDSNN